ncbi:MAG: peptidylprolyl isomerase [Candidatus Methylacidiphilales bacterium]|nr:peptidylprolyl isomerase [Candidatus Methylacidiphilales bacterium]
MVKVIQRAAGVIVLVVLTAPVPSLRAQVVDGVAAVVNDKVITFSQVRKEVDPTEAQYRDLYSGVELVEKVKEARLSSLKSLIERELIIQEFNTKGFFIPENVIEERIRKIVKDQYEGDRTALIRTLQANGMSVTSFKEQIRNQIIVQAMRSRNVSSSVIVSPYQIEQYYQDNVRQFVQPDQAKLRMIFLRKGLFKEKRTDAKGQTREVDPQRLIMEDILAKVKTGSDFGSLARGYTDGPQRQNGGDLGWVSESSLRSELTKVAFNLMPGQNSPIIETEDGYYLLQVEEIRKSTVIALNDVRERIENTLLQQERERLQQDWLDGLRSKAFIKMFF